MENEILSPEMNALITSLGELIKADERHAAIQAAIAEYETCEDLNKLVGEYNRQQQFLVEAYNNGTKLDETFKSGVQHRIDELYTAVTTHPTYVKYLEAKDAFDELEKAVYSEIQFAVTGHRPCEHNCESCHSDCADRH